MNLKKIVYGVVIILSIIGVVSCKKQKVAENKLEIFSWWTAGGEATGLEAMIQIFKDKNPNVEVINATVAGGAGSNAKAVLSTRLQGGNPPDSFQVHAGHELIDSWVAAGKIEPINFIFEDNGFLSAYPQGVIDVISKNGNIYSVPVNIHRSNMIWYNVEVFKRYGIKRPETLDDFFSVCEQLKKSGIQPIALGDNGIWTSTHVFESILVATLGAEKYTQLWEGTVDWTGDLVQSAFKNFSRYLDYVNSDHAALSWDAAAQYVLDGKCAMTMMGDWAEGYFISKGLKPNIHFGYMPTPGTTGTFIMLSDSFCLPKNAEHRQNAIEWLTICASKEGQDAFNPLKGSIPSRTDGDKSLYDEYLQKTMHDFSTDIILPSLAHGAAAPEGFVTRINDVMTLFVGNRDIAQATSSLQMASDKYLK